MKYIIRSAKMENTDAIKEYIENKLTRLDKYFQDSDEIEANVLTKVNGKNQTIEVTIPTKHFTLRNEETNEDLYAAIDKIVDKLERQIRKNKTRLKAKYKKEVLPDFIFDFEVTEEENEDKIVKRKKIDVKPMDEEEAILQMELLGHDFYVFNNIDEECISVLYRRKDGNYGIINTK